jgi:two-component system sensor histidine kinase VicK
MIKRVFGNLLSNAIKFTRPGGFIEVSVKTVAEKVVVSFRDNGIGIPETLIGKIFNKYTTAGRKGTEGESSTGLGMHIVKTLLDLHKAQIKVESKEMVGTTFVIEFSRVV